MNRIIKLVVYAAVLAGIYFWIFSAKGPANVSLSLVIGGALAVAILYNLIELGSSFVKLVIAAGVVLAVILYARAPSRNHSINRAQAEKFFAKAGLNPRAEPWRRIENFFPK